MADALFEYNVSMGLPEAEACKPKLKPTEQAALDSDEALLEGHGFSTPPKKDSSSDSDDFFDSLNVHESAKKRMKYSFDEQCSTAAPSPARTSTMHASPSHSPFLSRGSPVVCDLVNFSPSSPGVPCGVKDTLDFTHEAPPPAACPTTPRTGLPQSAVEMSTPPTTPRGTSCFHVDERPQPLPSTPRRKPAPPLLEALQVNSIAMVRDVIANDADAALFPFWDHNMEPPLCCATRLSCDAPIISNLLESRADVNATNVDGMTALDIVRRPAHRRGDNVGLSDAVFAFTSAFPPNQNRDEVERLLLAAGACLSEATESEETSSMSRKFRGAELRLPGDHDFGC